MSLVTWLPPTGMLSAKTRLPSKNTAIVVVPPPMSMTRDAELALVLDQADEARRHRG